MFPSAAEELVVPLLVDEFVLPVELAPVEDAFPTLSVDEVFSITITDDVVLEVASASMLDAELVNTLSALLELSASLELLWLELFPLLPEPPHAISALENKTSALDFRLPISTLERRITLILVSTL